MILAACETLVSPLSPSMSQRYAGVPARPRHRPTVPRAVRNSNSIKAREGKENLEVRAREIYADTNRRIHDLADETGHARSVVAHTVFSGGTRDRARRGVNAKNAWVSIRMKEINEGIFLIYFILATDEYSSFGS